MLTDIDKQRGLNSVRDFLIAIGEDPDREGLEKTPERVVRSWYKLYGGYFQDPKQILGTVFEDGACDEIVILKNIRYYSSCEHHCIPFYGDISIGYIPDGKVVGISKLARLVEVYARRLQIQERMTAQIADTLMEVLKPKGVMVVCNGQHLCMIARGVEKPTSVMTTSAVRGVFKTNQATRNEFMSLIK